MPKSNVLALVFVAIATILVCAYIYDPTRALMVNTMVAMHAPKLLVDFFDVTITSLLLILGLIAVALGADFPPVMVVGTMAGFILLTLLQNDLIKYMTFAALLFCIGMYGMVVSRNAVRVLMSIELMINAVNINLVALARYVDPVLIRGQVFAIFILTVAAAEAAVGLAIVLAIYRNNSTVDMEKFNLLKW